MKAHEIEAVAQYQNEHFLTVSGSVQRLDVGVKVIQLDGLEFELNEIAFEQALTRLGVNNTYHDFEKDPEFFQTAVNRKIAALKNNSRKSPTMVIYDEAHNRGLAIKTEKYIPLHNLSVFDYAVGKWGENFNEEYSFITDYTMRLCFGDIRRFEAVGKGMKVGDLIAVGSQIWNSETGWNALTIAQFLQRLACLNGMLTTHVIKPFREQHVVPDLMPKLEAGMEQILVKGNPQAIIERAMNRPAIIERADQIPEILTDMKIKRIYHEPIVNSYLEEPLGKSDAGINAWGVYNGVTRFASRNYPKQFQFNYNEQQDLMLAGFQYLVR